MRRAALPVLVAAALLASGTAAHAATVPVTIQFSAFAPSALDVLPGETVQWSNVSERRHTVFADDGSFASGDLLGGDEYAREFDEVGSYPYHCTVHAGMVGEVDVRRVTLETLPPAAVPAGQPVEFSGRTADPGLPVRIQRAEGDDGTTVATVTPAADGTWSTSIPAQRGGDYRAVSDAGTSEVRHLFVSDRKVLVRATRTGLAVTVTPSLPYARIVLQLDLRERFGWWPQRSTRLDYVSQATFAVARPARARVVLVDKDGWTPLATSRVLTLGRVRTPAPKAHPAPMAHHMR